jgi:signal transduction histidine kinase
VLNNFVSNAIKFSEGPGELFLRVDAVSDIDGSKKWQKINPNRTASEGADKLSLEKFRSTSSDGGLTGDDSLSRPPFLKFSVQDRGIGISADDQTKLFKAFSQVK